MLSLCRLSFAPSVKMFVCWVSAASSATSDLQLWLDSGFISWDPADINLRGRADTMTYALCFFKRSCVLSKQQVYLLHLLLGSRRWAPRSNRFVLCCCLCVCLLPTSAAASLPSGDPLSHRNLYQANLTVVPGNHQSVCSKQEERNSRVTAIKASVNGSSYIDH